MDFKIRVEGDSMDDFVECTIHEEGSSDENSSTNMADSFPCEGKKQKYGLRMIAKILVAPLVVFVAMLVVLIVWKNGKSSELELISGSGEGAVTTRTLPVNYFLGSQAIYGDSWVHFRVPPFQNHSYSEPGYDMLTEFREAAAVTGMNQFKFKLASDTCESYQLSCNSSQLVSLTDLSQVPEILATFDDSRFSWYHLWLHSFTLPKKLRSEITEEVKAAEYQEVYDWAVYILTTYENTNKVFFVGTWEGDKQMLWASGCRDSSGFNMTCVPSEEVINRYIVWSNIRQEAIRDAKRDYPADGVDIFHYVEFDLAEENWEDHPSQPGVLRPTILNSVVPAVNPDFLSYSSYASTDAYCDHDDEAFDLDRTTQAFWDVLDYAESKLNETDTDFSIMGGLDRRVFVGEFGVKRNDDPYALAKSADLIFKSALEWGCPFVLQSNTFDSDSSYQPLVSREATDVISNEPLWVYSKEWNVEARVMLDDQSSMSSSGLLDWGVDWSWSSSDLDGAMLQSRTYFPTTAPSSEETTLRRTHTFTPESPPMTLTPTIEDAVLQEEEYIFNNNFFIGSQSIYGSGWSSYRIAPFADHGYNEMDFDMLTENREAAALAGMNQFKFKFAPSACQNYQLSCDASEVQSLTELAQVTEMAATFEDPRFAWYHMWVTTYNLPKMYQTTLSEAIWQAEYDEMYDWATHMLTTYQGSNKTFFVGAWEGDWKMMWASDCRTSDGFNKTCIPTDSVIDIYITWSNIRQKAIDDAKSDTVVEGVDIFHYIEFNLGDENFEEHPDLPGQPRPTILNSVVPFVNPDFLSYSSYSRTNDYSNYFKENFDLNATNEAFWSLLDYAESKLTPTTTDMSVMGGLSKRVFIGEFGVSRNKASTRWVPTACHVFRAALTWGTPFVLQWELYDNDSNQQPLVARDVSNQSSLGDLMQLYADWHAASDAFVLESNPTSEDLRIWGINWFAAYMEA